MTDTHASEPIFPPDQNALPFAEQLVAATPTKNTGGALPFEEKLWAAADKMRGHMDASEYKHVFLGLIFLKYISDTFLERYITLQSVPYADPEDRDEYLIVCRQAALG